MKNTLTMIMIAAMGLQGAYAQESPLTEGPPNAEVGKCYAKCYIHSQYKEVTEQVLMRPAHKKMVVEPAHYETVSEQVLVKEKSSRLVPVDPTYETVSEQKMVKEASKRLVPKAASYESKTERVMVKEASTRWVKKNDPNCISSDPNDCMVLCLEAVPAKYETVTSSVLASPAAVEEFEVPAEYVTITKKVVRTPASTREVEMPAEYRTITKRVLKSPARVQEIEVPAEYSTVTKRELVKEGAYTEWREILCDSKVTTTKISQIQAALIKAGYDVGPAGADNVMGKATRDALTEYQKDNKLPVGNLNLETLQALGVQ